MKTSNRSVIFWGAVVYLGAVIAAGYGFRMKMNAEAAKIAYAEMKATPARPTRPVITELPPWHKSKEERLVPIQGKLLFVKDGDKKTEEEKEREKEGEEERGKERKTYDPSRGGELEIEIPKGTALVRMIEDVAKKIDTFHTLDKWGRIAVVLHLSLCQIGLGREPDKRLQDEGYILHYQHDVASYVRGWVKLVDIKEEQF